MKFNQDFDAVVGVICTDRGRHDERLIEAMKRDGKRWFSVSEELTLTGRDAYESGLAERTDRGDPGTRSKWIERDGHITSRYRGDVRSTRHGYEVECPECRRRQFPGVTFFRCLDVAAAHSAPLDVSMTPT